MRQAPQHIAENIVPNADNHTWVTEYDKLSITRTPGDTRPSYTVHLNDDETTTLYYTGA